MKISRIAKLDPQRYGTVVIPLFGRPSPASVAAIGREFPELAGLLQRKNALAKNGDTLFCHSPSGRRQYLLVAAGRSRRPSDARTLACRIMSQLLEKRVVRAGLYFAADTAITHEYLCNLIDFLQLNNYRFDRYQRKKSRPVQRIDLVCRHKALLTAPDIRASERINRSVVFCRDLVNEIPAKMTPDALVEAAADLAKEHPLKLTVLKEPELIANGLNGLLAVGAAAGCPPALIRLEYAPSDHSRHVMLVGKGITFDAGGLNLKPRTSLDGMKSDMAGAAVVFAVVKSAAMLNLPVKVTALAPVAENMPGGRAYKPGDIVRFANNKTVEIVDTDAEGRLILADALVMAARQKPAAIIELSTLTGGVITALGDGMAGLMCRNRRLKTGLMQAAEASGELLWELPLFAPYRKDIGSKIADLKNANYHGGSCIKAGLFLAEFTGNVPFAHIDIAGTAFLNRPGFWLSAEGATGFGVRLLLNYLKNLS